MTDSDYTPTSPWSQGSIRYWRVRAQDESSQYGVWSSIFQVTILDYSVGDIGPAGGIVFYDKGAESDGWRYLEAAPNDYGPGIVWGGYETLVDGTSTAIGTGAANTAAIIAEYGDAEPYEGKTDYAAKLCADLSLNGYDDWFLPSKDELNELYLQRATVGGFSSDDYWSSSENSYRDAWAQVFSVGGQSSDAKFANLTWHVRPVRAF